jgi:tetratricopeptide (TPR) repeat protein
MSGAAVSKGAIAKAATSVRYGPEPAWVKLADLPPAPPAEPGAAYAVRLSDNQFAFNAAGEESYTRTAIQILSEVGLQAGSLTQEWDPATETVTVNHLTVLRDDQVIDVLASDRFEVLRRETNLESSMLDGRLTAALQIKGLRVGDIIDLAVSRTFHDPLLGGRSEEGVVLGHGGVAGRVRYRALWSKDRPMTWRKGVALAQPTVSQAAGGTELLLDMSAIKAPVAPVGAPMRYASIGSLAFSAFGDWSEISSLMAPVYRKAAVLEPNSPLKAEAAKIKAASPDPTARAALALKLVESQVRYVFVGLNGGGLTPATADDTWRHRFGDCKGKTVLLLALLTELDIPAEPALVNASGFGDGLDGQLPRLGMFDHVVTRATIGGRVYWLDGTRSGDEILATLETPPFDWALPLRTGGAKLERLERQVASRPSSETVLRIDASAGADVPAQVTVEQVFRGDAAIAINRQVATLPRDELARANLRTWSSKIDWVEFKDVDWRYDPTAALFAITLHGSGKIDWGSENRRQWDLEGSAISLSEFERDSAQDADAPFSVAFPTYVRWVTSVILPDGGEAFSIAGKPVDETIGGVAIRRITRGDRRGQVVMLRSQRSLGPEISAADAKAATARARRVDSELGVVAIMPKPAATKAKAKAGASNAADTGPLARGRAALAGEQFAEAGRQYEKVLSADPTRTEALGGLVMSWVGRKMYDKAAEACGQGRLAPAEVEACRTHVLIMAKREDEAVALAMRGLARDPKSDEAQSVPLLLALADAHAAQGKTDLVAQDLDRVLAVEPKSLEARRFGARNALKAKDYADALRRFEALVAQQPDDVGALLELAGAQARAGDPDEAVRQIDEALRVDPFSVDALSLRSNVNLERGRYGLAVADADQALSLRPDVVSLLNGGCWVRAVWGQELDKALADCDAALKMQPQAPPILDSRGLVHFRQGRFDDAVRDYDAALALSPKQAASLYGRGLTKLKLGDKAAGQADLTAALALDADLKGRFEGYGLKAD